VTLPPQLGSVLRARKPAAHREDTGPTMGSRNLSDVELELWEPLLQLPEGATLDGVTGASPALGAVSSCLVESPWPQVRQL
jgi:hypothetical protein